MRQGARVGAPLEELVGIGVKYCRLAEALWPRTGRGRPPEIPDWVLAVMIMVGVMHRRKSKAAQLV
jgi:hypothetical protein